MSNWLLVAACPHWFTTTRHMPSPTRPALCCICCRFIGYRPGDPTAAVPPAVMPAPSVPAPPGGLKTLDLRQMSMAQLHAEAAATQTRDLFAALLPDPPGALRCAALRCTWRCGGLGVVDGVQA